MSSRVIAPLLAAAAVVFACGTLPRSALRLRTGAAPEVDIGRDQDKPRKAQRSDSAHIDASLVVRQSADEVRFALAVVNDSRQRLELNFPNGQTREFVVLDSTGRERWRWSTGRLFTQAMQNKLLAAGDTVMYAERWVEAEPGRYTVVAVLRSGNFPLTRRADFVVGTPGATHIATK